MLLHVLSFKPLSPKHCNIHLNLQGTAHEQRADRVALKVRDLVVVTAEGLMRDVAGTIMGIEGDLGRLHVKVQYIVICFSQFYFLLLVCVIYLACSCIFTKKN